MEKSLQKVQIGNGEIAVKEYAGKRVVTFKDIDNCHGRPEGTASRNFRSNREHFIEGEDYFYVDLTDNEIRRQFGAGKNAGRTIVLLTESGYLMLVKSFTDDLAWDVQRELVNRYFVQEHRAGGKTSEMQTAEIIQMAVTAAIETVTRILPTIMQYSGQAAAKPESVRVRMIDVSCPQTQGKLEGFPPEIVEEVNRLFENMIRQQSINFSYVARFCTANGYPISNVAVKNYYDRHFK